MKGVIPAAGEGTRMGELTTDQPKGMVEVGGEPLLTHVFRTVVETGVDELVVIVGFEMESIVSHFGDEFAGVPIRYVHQREPTGLAAAILRAAPYIEEQFVVLNGDNVFVDRISESIDHTLDSDVDAALLVETATPEQAKKTGVVEVENSEVTNVVEKPSEPKSQLVTTGCYVLNPEIFDAIQLLRPYERGEYELNQAVNLLVQAGATVEAVRFEGERVNVNTQSDIKTAERLLRSE